MLVPSGRKRELESDEETQTMFQGLTEKQGRGKGKGTGPGRGRGRPGAEAAKPTQADTRQNKAARRQSFGLRRSDAEGGGDFAS